MTKTADLTKYRRPGQELVATSVPDPIPQPPTGKRPYEAYRQSKEAKRHLEIRVKFPDSAECPLNSMITNIRAEWRWGMAITLIYGKTMLVEIKGERLQALFEALKDWQVQWIEAYDPDFHVPPEENAPIIHSIEITTERPEDPPPLSQRH